MPGAVAWRVLEAPSPSKLSRSKPARSRAHAGSLALLVLVTVIWGTTFPIVKTALDTLPAGLIIATRFAVASLPFLPFLRRATRATWLAGGRLAVVTFISFIAQLLGMMTISSNRAAFITALNVILVPLFISVARRKPAWPALGAALLCLSGLALMSFEGGGVGVGDLLVFICALAYAAYILMLEREAPRHDAFALTGVQLLAVTLMGGVWSLFSTTPGQLRALNDQWGVIIYLGLAATAAATLIQAFAQRHVSATETSVTYALEPVFASVFAFALLGERLGVRGLAGAALVVAAMIASQLGPRSTLPEAPDAGHIMLPEPPEAAA